MKCVNLENKLSLLVITFLGVQLSLGACALSQAPKRAVTTTYRAGQRAFTTPAAAAATKNLWQRGYQTGTSASETGARAYSSFAMPIGGYGAQAGKPIQQRRGFSSVQQVSGEQPNLIEPKAQKYLKKIMSDLTKPKIHFMSTPTTFRNLGDTIEKTYKLTTEAQGIIDRMNVYLGNLTLQLRNAGQSVPEIVLDSAKYRLSDIPAETDRILAHCDSLEMCENALASLLRNKYWKILVGEILEEQARVEEILNSIGIGKKQIPSGSLTNYTSNEPLNKVFSIHREIQDLVQSGQIKGQVGQILYGAERKNVEGLRSWAQYTGDMPSQVIQEESMAPAVEPVD